MAKILVAEDDEIMRGYIAHTLEADGHEVVSVGHGVDALEQLKKQADFDLLFTDIVMPEMDGLELSGRARVLYPNLKIMYVSGFIGSTLGGDEDSVAMKIISKPFNLKDLVRQVNDALAEK